jgi:putative DNA primase/helicase
VTKSSEPSGQDIERRLVEGLIVSDAFTERLAPEWRDEFLESPELGKVARWCLKYFSTYGKTPGRHIEDIYIKELKANRLEKSEAEYIERVLSRVSDEYERGEQFNAQYLFDRATEYFRARALTRHNEQVQDLVDSGELARAEELYPTYKSPIADELKTLDGIEPRAVTWLWPGRIPMGKVTIIAGKPSVGKTTLGLDVVARATAGGHWPDGQRVRRGSFLIVTAEDDYEDTIVPRLMAAGAERSRCYAVDADGGIKGLCAKIDRMLTSLKKLDQVQPRGVLIDPLGAFLGGTDSHNDAQVRSALKPLAEVAMKHRVAVVVIMHLRKAGAGPAIDQVSGSLAFTAMARAAYLVATDPGEATRSVVLCMKNNLGPPPSGIAYRVVPAELSVPGKMGRMEITTSKLAWCSEPVTVTADDIIATRREDGPSKLDEAKEWLTCILNDGPMSQKDIFKRAARQGFKDMTLRRAAKEAGVEIKKTGFTGGWNWSIP